MKVLMRMGLWFGLVIPATLIMPFRALAQRDVHWQINPRGFPSDVSVFVDVEDSGVFKRDLPASAFAVSMDEYAGDQGGWIINQQAVSAGLAGAQVLIMVDKSRSYTGAFAKAKRVMRAIVRNMDPQRDAIAVATAPAAGGFSEAKLELAFTSDQAALLKAIDSINPLPSGDNSGARICNALSEGLRWFPEQPSNRYRIVVFLTGGADKGEGKGNCIEDSFEAGKVPFFPIVFSLDRRYDDPRNAHKIENKTYELAQATGGRSIFRRSENDYMQFAGLLWNRIRSQYLLRVTFPCYRPMPVTEHASILKVEGRDAEGIKFQATSAPAPTPTIKALYPSQATRKDIDAGSVKLTIDGSGFCGPPGTVRVSVGRTPVHLESLNPFRIVAPLTEAVDTGKVSVINRFGQRGESLEDFKIAKPPRGAEASATLTALVIGLVVLSVIAILIVSLKSRKAQGGGASGAKKPAPPAPRMPSAPPTTDAKAKTMAVQSISKAWIEGAEGKEFILKDGANLIGREPTCEIPLTVTGVSRTHARIEMQMAEGLIWVEDLGSTNGTYWGGPNAKDDEVVRLEEKHLLSSGDVIWISGTRLIVHIEGGTRAPGEG
ncbi:MAG: FHA domain-containing protein [Myxococcota bacterium]|nr:FHA domain-containing protein [Myxococcota bacterium]